jgi:UV DNA damage repair endonuclease
LWEILKGNIEAVRQLVKVVSTLPPARKMCRITSDILQAYTHPQYRDFYKQGDVLNYMERAFAAVGNFAREQDVRLSFHPGQFTVLASENPGIVENSIEEFEYHADMARMMGYGQQFQDFKINVHISGKRGPDGIRAAYSRLSPEARNCITLENEENSWGLDDTLLLSDIIPTVLDIHHHWIREASYIQPDDPRIQMILDSWRGVRPTMHYSVSREDYLVDHPTDILPDYNKLIATGHKKLKLRAHSDMYWNTACNQWALSFNDKFDLMCEAKCKNVASEQLFLQKFVN